MTAIAYEQRAQYLDLNGDPLTLGSVTFYSAGTTTLKEIYLDNAKTTPATNPHELDTSGRVGTGSGGDGTLFYGTGNYKVVLKDKDDSVVWTVDNIVGDTSLVVGGFSLATVDNIESLKALDVSLYSLAYVVGYTDKGDNGGGWFHYDSTNSDTDNGGTIINPDGGGLGRWLRILNDDAIRPEMFGAIPEQPLLNVVTNLESMIDWCNDGTNQKNIQFSPSKYYINGDVLFDGELIVNIPDGCEFVKNQGTGESMVTISCYDAVIDSFNTPLVDPTGLTCSTNLTFNIGSGKRDAFVEWWGCQSDGANSDVQLLSCIANTDSRIVMSGGDSYLSAAEPDFTGKALVVRNDSKLQISDGITLEYLDIQQENPFLSGDFTNVTFIKRDIFDADWFDFSTTGNVTSDFNDLVTSLTGSTKAITMNWNRGAYVFSLGIDDGRFLRNNLNGASLKFNARISFGTVLSGSGFDIAGSSFPSLHSKEINVSWFGAIPSDSSSAIKTINTNAITYAINTQMGTFGTGSASVIGEDGAYYLDSAIDVNQTFLNSEFITLKDIDFAIQTGFTPVTITDPYAIALRGDTRLINVGFTNGDSVDTNGIYCDGSLNVNGCNLYNEANNRRIIDHISSSDLVINQSSTFSDDGIYTDTNSLKLESSSIDGESIGISALSCTEMLIANNTFKRQSDALINYFLSTNRAVVSGNLFSGGMRLHFVTGCFRVAITGNTFWRCDLMIEDPRNMGVIGNVFGGGAEIHLNTDVTDSISTNLTITGNNFSNTVSSGSIISFFGSGNFATSGHTALIDNNTAYNMSIKSTRGTATGNINAYDEFGYTINDDTDAISVVALSYDPNLILRGDTLRITGQQIDTVKDSVGSEISNTVLAGLVGLYYSSDSVLGVLMKGRWIGFTALTNAPEDAYYQNVTLSIDWSAQ